MGRRDSYIYPIVFLHSKISERGRVILSNLGPESFERKREGLAERAKAKVTFPSVADLVEKMLSPSAPTGVTS